MFCGYGSGHYFTIEKVLDRYEQEQFLMRRVVDRELTQSELLTMLRRLDSCYEQFDLNDIVNSEFCLISVGVGLEREGLLRVMQRRNSLSHSYQLESVIKTIRHKSDIEYVVINAIYTTNHVYHYFTDIKLTENIGLLIDKNYDNWYTRDRLIQECGGHGRLSSGHCIYELRTEELAVIDTLRSEREYGM